MKNFNRRRHTIWIFICIFECAAIEVSALISNQHDDKQFRRELNYVDRVPNGEVLPNIHNIIDNSNYKDTNNRIDTADSHFYYGGNDGLTQRANIDIHPSERYVSEHPYCKNGCRKEHHNKHINNINTRDFNTNSQHNYNRNSENIDARHNISTIYLAGYDDQIFKLMYDIQKQGIGRELLVYFYLYTNNSFRNIGYFYTNKNILRDCIIKYTHYFCVGHNRNDCLCLKSLGNINSQKNLIVEIDQEVNNKPELNKINGSCIPGKYNNNEAEIIKLCNKDNKIKEPKVYYPEKQSSSSYEFILPRERDIKFKDIYIDVLKSQEPKALHANQTKQGIDNTTNTAIRKVEIRNNVISDKSYVTSTESIFSQQSKYDLNGNPTEANVDSIMKQSDNTVILTNRLNTDNNKGNYIYGITDQEKNLPATDISLQLKPSNYKEQEYDNLTSNLKMQVMDCSKPEVKIIPNMEKLVSQNTILRKTTATPINIVTGIINETNFPNVNSEYVTYSQNSPEQKNAIIINPIAANDSDATVSLTSVPFKGVLEINPNLEYPNVMNDSITTKLNDNYIILNPVPSNEVIEETAINNVPLNEVDGQNNKSNIMAIGGNTCDQNMSNITVFTPYRSTAQKPDTLQSITSNTNISNINLEMESVLAIEHESRNSKESDVDYLKFPLPEANIPLMITEKYNNKNKVPKQETEKVKLQFPCNNIDKFVNANYDSIPNSDTYLKDLLPSHVHHYNDGFHVNIQPCSNINYDIFDNKRHRHIHPWNYLQYNHLDKENQPKSQCLEQKNKEDVLGQWPCNMLQTIPGDIPSQYDTSHEYDTNLRKTDFIQNTNLHTLDPIKYLPTSNLLQPLLSNYKNIVKYLDPVADLKAEKIFDLHKVTLDDKQNFQDPQKVTSLLKETTSPKIVAHLKNYDHEKNQIGIYMPNKEKEHSENYVGFNNKPIFPIKYNAISSTKASVSHYPYTAETFYGYKPNLNSKTSYIQDPCTFKNILTLEGNLKPNLETVNTSKKLADKGDTSLLIDNVTPNHQHNECAYFVSNNDHLHIPKNIPLKHNTNALQMNQYNNKLPHTYDKLSTILYPMQEYLKPITSEIDLSYKNQYDISTLPSKPNKFSMHSHPSLENYSKNPINMEIPRREVNRISLINRVYDIANNVPLRDNLFKPFNEYINTNPQKLQNSNTTVSATILLNKLGLNGSPKIYQPYSSNYETLTNNIPCRTSSILLPSSKLKHTSSQKGFSQSVQMHNNLGPNKYSIVEPKTKHLAQDGAVKCLLNNNNIIPISLNTALLHNVSPTVLNSYYDTSTLPKPIASNLTDSTYHPSSHSFSVTPMSYYYPCYFVPINSIKGNAVSNGDFSSNLLLPQPAVDSSKNIIMPCGSSSQFLKERPYVSDAEHVPKSKFISYFIPKRECDITIQSSMPVNLSNLKSLASRHTKNENISATFSVFPLSALMQEKRTQTPFLGSTASYKPFQAEGVLLPSKQSKTIPSLIGLGNFTCEPTSCYSESMSPYQLSFKIPSNYVSLPEDVTPFTKAPFNKALPQNIVTYTNDPPNSISFPVLKPSNIQPLTDTINPLLSYSLPVDAIVRTHTVKPSKYDPTLYSIFKPINAKLSTGTNFVYFPEKPEILTPNEKPEIISPTLISSFNPKLFSTYPTKDLKSSVLSQIYSISPKLHDGNINPWILSSYKRIQPKTQSTGQNLIETVYPSTAEPKILAVQENAPLTDNQTSLLPMQNFISTNTFPAEFNLVPRQPCQYHGNLETLIPSETISTGSYNPSTSSTPEIIPCIPPYIQVGKPKLQVNNIKNNFPSVYQIPTNKPVPKEVPLKYGKSYGLSSPVTSTEIPKYGLPSQIPFIETTPLDTFNTVPELALQSTIPTKSKLGVQRPIIWSMNISPNHSKPSESYNVWPSSFFRYKIPKLSANNMFILNPSSYNLQNQATSVPSSLTEATFPATTSNAVLPTSNFDTFSSSSDSFKYKFDELSPLLPDKVSNIPYSQRTVSNLGNLPKANILSFNLHAASKSSDVTSNPVDILQVQSLAPGFHLHTDLPLDYTPNQFNYMVSSILPYSKVLTKSDDQKCLFNLFSSNTNVAPIFPLHNYVTCKPSLGRAPLASSIAKYNPSTISPSGLGTWASIPKPKIQKQNLSPCYDYLLSNEYSAYKTLKRPLQSSNFDYQTKPFESKTDYINLNDLNFSNLQASQQAIPLLLNPQTSKLSPIATDTTICSILGSNKLTSTLPSSYSLLIKPNYTSLKSVVYPSPSSSMKVPFSSSLSCISENTTLTPLSSNVYLPSTSLWKTLSPTMQNLDFILYPTDVDSAQRSSQYASSIPQKYSPIPNYLQLSSNNPDSISSTYLRNPTIEESNPVIYQNPLSNNLGYYKYGNIYQNNQITKTTARNLPQVAHTNQPYLETLANPENMPPINKINNDVNKYIKESDLLNNILNQKVLTIPLHNMSIVKCEPTKLDEVSYVKTDNPNINLKVWPSAVQIVKAKIVFEIDKLRALNFCPVVKVENQQYTNEEILKLVEGFVKKFYGEPIVVKTVQKNQNYYACVDNVDESCIKNGKVYIVWANICDCGCNRMGCQCGYKNNILV